MGNAQRAPERIDDGIHNCWTGANGASLAGSLYAQWVMLTANVACLKGNGGYLVRARQGIVHQARGQELAGVGIVDSTLHECLTDALRGAAMDLTSEQQRNTNPHIE